MQLEVYCRIRTPGICVSDLSFQDVVRSSNKREFVFDAYAQRCLIFFPLLHYQVRQYISQIVWHLASDSCTAI